MASLVAIYTLADPRTGAVRYVGKSQSPARRLRDHVTDSRSGVFPIHRWMRFLLARKLRPLLEVLEWIEEGQWGEAERRWIAHYRALNGRRSLLNVTDGGDCGPVKRGSEHPNSRLTEEIVRCVREDRAAGLSEPGLAAKYGIHERKIVKIIHGECWASAPGPIEPARPQVRQFTDEEVEAIRTLYASREVSQSELARRFDVEQYYVSRLCTGKSRAMSPGPITSGEGRRATGAANGAPRKLTADQVRDIRARYAAGGIFRWQLAAEYGVTESAVDQIIWRKSWRHVE